MDYTNEDPYEFQYSQIGKANIEDWMDECTIECNFEDFGYTPEKPYMVRTSGCDCCTETRYISKQGLTDILNIQIEQLQAILADVMEEE